MNDILPESTIVHYWQLCWQLKWVQIMDMNEARQIWFKVMKDSENLI